MNTSNDDRIIFLEYHVIVKVRKKILSRKIVFFFFFWPRETEEEWETWRGLGFIRVAYPFKEILDDLNGVCYVISSGNGF